MKKFLQYTIVLAAFIPLASFAGVEVRPYAFHSGDETAISESYSEGEMSPDSIQTLRVQPDFQDSLQNGRKQIKEITKARRQPKPERVDNRPPPDQGQVGNEQRRQPPPPADRQNGQGGRMGPAQGGGLGGRMNDGGGAGGGGGQRPQAPPQGRGR